MNDASEFIRLTTDTLRRFCAQSAVAAPADAELEACGRRLLTLIGQRGLLPPLRPGEQGEPGEISEPECDRYVASVFDGAAATTRETVAVPVRQLVKACFYPEFKICRDSFREVSADGSCRRQQLSKVRQRVSGTHCVDCPYWVSLTRAQHEKFLARHWQPAGRENLAEHLTIFLPEDFRAFRRWVRAAARARIQA